jgi:hypothetical protein
MELRKKKRNNFVRWINRKTFTASAPLAALLASHQSEAIMKSEEPSSPLTLGISQPVPTLINGNIMLSCQIVSSRFWMVTWNSTPVTFINVIVDISSLVFSYF